MRTIISVILYNLREQFFNICLYIAIAFIVVATIVGLVGHYDLAAGLSIFAFVLVLIWRLNEEVRDNRTRKNIRK